MKRVMPPEMTREALYVASTRGRTATHWSTVTDHLLDPTTDHEPDPPATVGEVVTGVLARTGVEDSATSTVRDTDREARELPTLVARYQHAWNHAALDTLRTADTILSPQQAARLLADPGAPRLAQALADAATRGAPPAQVLRAAVDYDQLTGLRSPALVLATRISDYPTTLGIPRREPDDKPLPWLPAPDIGHPAWTDYLQHRAQLITERAHDLGSLPRAYREQYRLTHLPAAKLGPVPTEGSQQRAAFVTALKHRQRQARLPTADSDSQARRVGSPPPPPARHRRARPPGLTC
jgi:hypothetical protein